MVLDSTAQPETEPANVKDLEQKGAFSEVADQLNSSQTTWKANPGYHGTAKENNEGTAGFPLITKALSIHDYTIRKREIKIDVHGRVAM